MTDRFAAKGLLPHDYVHTFPHANATAPYVGQIDLVTEHYVRIAWAANHRESRYDIIAKVSPLWNAIQKGQQ